MRAETVGERAGGSRQALVTRLLAAALAEAPAGDRRPQLLDCGGGSGTYAVPLAQATGAVVTVVDISADALATLRRRADEAGVGAQVRPVQGDVEALDTLDTLTALAPADGFDLVLAHGVLEAVDQVESAFALIGATVRPGGLLSLLVENPAAAVVARALAGDPEAALAELERLDTAGARLGPDTLVRMCRDTGFTVQARHGIGVFSDLVPGAALDAPAAREALARLDAAAADRAPFADLAGRVHLLARRAA